MNELREGNHEQWGPDAKVWDWYLASYAAEFEEHDVQQLTDKLREARAVQGSWLTRRRAFAQRENRFLNLLDARICGQRDTLYDDFVRDNMERAGKKAGELVPHGLLLITDWWNIRMQSPRFS